MKRTVLFFGCVCVFGLCFLAIQPAHGQAATGRIIGTVYDQQGAIVPDAKVTVTNVATRISNTTTTRGDGTFEVLNLPIGAYRVEAEHAGFNKVALSDQELQINQSLRVDITLTLGATSETVTVEAQAPIVETENPTVGGTITGAAIQQAPLNGRNALNLALLQPGVTETNPDNTAAGSTRSSGNYSIAGGRTDSVTFLLDGSLNNNLLSNAVVFDPNPETIAEFRILESDYTAEYGRNGGGIVSVVTKSGTNQWHGSGFDFLRNRDLDANSYFRELNGSPRDPLIRNQYGGSFGGPITIPHLVNGKDRFFFFVGYQGQKQSDQTTPASSQVPVLTNSEVACIATPAQGCDFSSDPGVVSFLAANPFLQDSSKPAGFLNPQALNPIAVKYVTTGLMPVSASGIVTPVSSATDNENELTMRFDFLVTQNDKLTATLGGSRVPTLDPFVTDSNLVPFATVPGYSVTGQLNNYFVNAAYIRTISANMLNEFRFGTQRDHTLQGVPVGPNQAFTAEALGFGANLTPDNPTGPPILSFNNGNCGGTGNLQIGYTYGGPSTLVNNTFGTSDTLSWIRGAHDWKMGGGVSAYQNNQIFDFLTNGNFSFNGSLTGNAFADFLLGAPTCYEQAAAAPSNIRTKSTYGFVQDEWHVTKKLTFTLGLRYEYNSPKSDTLGRTFSIVPGIQSTRFPNAPEGLVFPGDKGAPSGVNFPDRNDWAPRIGFAWNPDGHGRTSVRGGFGVFYDILKAEDNFQFNGQPPFFNLSFLTFPSSLTGNVDCPASNQPGQVLTYFSDPFNSTCNGPNPFPSRQQLSGTAFFSQPSSLPFGFGLFFVDPHLRTPYTYQYNLSVQHELVPSLVFEVNYLGSSSHGLTALQDVNPFVLDTTNHILNLGAGDSTCPDGNAGNFGGAGCSFAAILEFRNAVQASYNAVTTSLTKQMADSPLGQVYFTLGYTYGHNIDDASGFRQRNSQVPSYQPELFRASGDSDVRHRITFSGGWDLPFDRAWKSGPKRLTQGWSLFPIFTWRTGFPLDIFANLPSAGSPFQEGPSGAGDANIVHANVVGPTNSFDPKRPQTFTNTNVQGATPNTGAYWFNPNSFINLQSADIVGDCSELATEPIGTFPSDAQAVNCPALRTYGSLPRNFLRGPGGVNLDLSLSKTTAITERFKVEIRGDFFNILNHAEFSNPDTNISSSTFGAILNTGVPGDERPRIIQIAARFSF